MQSILVLYWSLGNGMSSGGWDVEHLGIILESLKWDELLWMRCRAS